MTLDELFTRVIRSHFPAIVLIALLPVGLVLALGFAQPRDWSASVRIQATSAVPTSSTEAEALSSRILAIATTPSVVHDALKAAHLKGDAVIVSEKHVAAQRLGESPVVELTVTDSTGPHAKALVDQLSVRVLTFMNNADRGRFETAVEDVNRRLGDSRTQRDRLAKQLAATPPGAARDQLKDLVTEAGRVASELSAQRASLIMADITRGRAVLVDGSHPTVLRVPSALLPRAGLALVLGVCLGIATAAAIETLRPKVPDARGLARILDAPMLASAKQAPAGLARMLSLVARRNGLDTLVIMAADPDRQASASALVRSLSRLSSERDRFLDRVMTDGASSAGSDRGDDEWSTSFVDLASLQHRQEVTAGIAVVCAGPVAHEHVEALHDVLRATRWPLIGVLDAGTSWSPDRPDVWTPVEEHS
ncbi:MAG: hypothetical protein JWR90_1062 [Marmoricola sp.]|jgi:hypothetical protein|nr:hypothetical protein [Marmoricola sp.]